METFYSQIINDSNLQAKLMLAFNKSYSTIYRWAHDKNLMLTTKIAQDVINEHNKSLELIEADETK
jgi:hypothetical protein